MSRGYISSALGAAVFIVLGYHAWGQGYLTPSAVQSINGCTTVCTVITNNIGSKTIATLPTCDNTTTPYGSIAYVTDLGGGANNAKCVAGAWQHLTLGIPGTNSSTTSQTITWTPLVSPPILQMTGTVAALNTILLQIQTTNLYAGYEACVVAPPSILGVLNISVSGTGVNIGILSGVHNCYVWNGTALVQIS